jgi:hypothetical protein
MHLGTTRPPPLRKNPPIAEKTAILDRMLPQKLPKKAKMEA